MNKIESQRLIIRRFMPIDADDLYEYLSREEVVRFEPYGVATKKNDCIIEAKRRSGDKNFWAVCQKESGKVIGNLYFARQEPDRINTWEMGYVFNSDYWSRGYAREACEALIDYAFVNLNAHRIVAYCNPKNVASWKLLERLRFSREGHLVKNMYFKKDAYNNPIWSDTYIYAMLGVEYLVRKTF